MATAKQKAAAAKKAQAAAKRKAGSVANAPTPEPEKHTVDAKFERLAALSIPMVKLNAGDTYALTIDSVRSQFLPGGSAKTCAVMLRAVDLNTGELCDVIAPTVLVSTLTRSYGALPEYDDKDKAGKMFESTEWDGKSILVETSKREGKRYMDVTVYEIKPKA